MGKILTIIGGIAVIVLGILGLVTWWWSFVELIKGFVPCLLILIGFIVFFAGMTGFKDEKTANKEDAVK